MHGACLIINFIRKLTVSDPRASVGIPRDPILGRRDSGTIYFVSKFGGVAVKENVSVE